MDILRSVGAVITMVFRPLDTKTERWLLLEFSAMFWSALWISSSIAAFRLSHESFWRMTIVVLHKSGFSNQSWTFVYPLLTVNEALLDFFVRNMTPSLIRSSLRLDVDDSPIMDVSLRAFFRGVWICCYLLEPSTHLPISLLFFEVILTLRTL